MQQKRIYAFLIDLLIASVPAFIFMDYSVFVKGISIEPVMYLSIFILIILLIFKDIRKGQSLGKYSMGLRVAYRPDTLIGKYKPGKIIRKYKSDNGSIMHKFGKAISLILRNITLLLAPLELLVFLTFDRRIGDFLFRTEVKATEQTTNRSGTPLIAGIFVMLLFLYLSGTNLIGLYIREKPEYILSEAFIYSSKVIKEKTGDVIGLGKIPKYTINNHDGQTDVMIHTKVYGKKENLKLIIFLTKKGEAEWKVTNYKYDEE